MTSSLKSSQPKNIDVRIRLLGAANVYWSESINSKNHKRTAGHHNEYFMGNETYIDNTKQVYGEGVLPAGTYNFDVNVQLPINCPASCKGKFGGIRYGLHLIVDRQYLFDNKFISPLTVLRNVDLNNNPSNRLPLQADDISSIGCWPCSSGQIFYNLNIPQSGYAPGQTLRYSLTVHNQSTADITGYKVKFVQRMVFTAHTPRHMTREKNKILVTDIYDDQCLRQMNRVFEGDLELPSMLPATQNFSIIRIEYYVELEMKVGGCCHTNNTIDAAIFVGNVPLVDINRPIAGPSLMPMPGLDNQYMPAAPSATLLNPNANNAANGKDAPPTYLETQPPTCAEAVRSESPFVDPDENEHTQIIGFKPLYPMYSSAPEK